MSEIVRKAFGASLNPMAGRQVRVVVSTGDPDRAGDVVVQSGIGLDGFKRSRTVLWNHDQAHPVAACPEIGLVGGNLHAVARFPEPGISTTADEVYGLIGAGIVNSASIGFLPIDVAPIDSKSARRGLRIARCELVEFSFVSVPANSGAEILQRALHGHGSGNSQAQRRRQLEVLHLAGGVNVDIIHRALRGLASGDERQARRCREILHLAGWR